MFGADRPGRRELLLEHVRGELDRVQRGANIVRDDSEDAVAHARGLARRLVEPSVLDRERGAPSQLHHERQILRRVAMRSRRCDDDRTDHAIGDDQRHRERGSRAQLAKQLQMLVVLSERDDEVIGDVIEDLRLLRRDRGARENPPRIERELLETLACRRQRGVGMRDRDAMQRRVAFDEVDDAELREVAHRDAGDVLQHLLAIERRRERRARFGKHLVLELHATPLGDVAERDGEQVAVAELELRDRCLGRELLAIASQRDDVGRALAHRP
ncbi:MAG TPA: hypothetical protein VFQ53_26680 [Kofleriaceae bacterium]|nr:hypothetical protein [Kofleriaceae bacterium]